MQNYASITRNLCSGATATSCSWILRIADIFRTQPHAPGNFLHIRPGGRPTAGPVAFTFSRPQTVKVWGMRGGRTPNPGGWGGGLP